MIKISSPVRRACLGVLMAGSMLAAGSAAMAQTAFNTPVGANSAQVRFSTPSRGPILAGGEVAIMGQGFAPGQPVTLLYGATPIATGLVADGQGRVTGRFTVPSNAVVGSHPIVVVSEAPYHAAVVQLKVSPTIPVFGTADYDVVRSTIRTGMYQSAFSARNNALFVTAAVGRPPVRESELVRLDPRTLRVVARATPGTAPDGGTFAVYGVGVDDANGNVWVTNTRQNTVAVYRQSDLALVKQFEPGLVNHSRDVVVNEESGRAYVSATFAPEVQVFDTRALTHAGTIAIASTVRGGTFSAASLSYDREARRLYVVSNSTNEVAVIDTRTETVLNVFPVPGADSAIGVSHDPVTDRIYVVAQGSDNLIILNGADGSVIGSTPVGAGSLNVVLEPVSRRLYISNRASSTVTVTDLDGRIVANFDNASLSNHVSVDGRGAVFVVNKSMGAEDANADTVWRIQARRPRR